MRLQLTVNILYLIALGVDIGSLLNNLLYALKYRPYNISSVLLHYGVSSILLILTFVLTQIPYIGKKLEEVNQRLKISLWLPISLAIAWSIYSIVLLGGSDFHWVAYPLMLYLWATGTPFKIHAMLIGAIMWFIVTDIYELPILVKSGIKPGVLEVASCIATFYIYMKGYILISVNRKTVAKSMILLAISYIFLYIATISMMFRKFQPIIDNITLITSKLLVAYAFRTIITPIVRCYSMFDPVR